MQIEVTMVHMQQHQKQMNRHVYTTTVYIENNHTFTAAKFEQFNLITRDTK